MAETYDIDIEPRKRSIKEKYRLAVIDEEDLKEIRSFRVSMLNIYILVSSIIVTLALLIVLLIFFTPLKRLVPGYADVNQNLEYRELQSRIAEVELTLQNQERYNESLRRMLQGGVSEDIDIDQNKGIQESLQDRDRKSGIILPEDIDDPQPKKILSSLFFVPPIRGPISSSYLEVESHFGVDILAAKNTPVKAVLDGIVVTSDWTIDGGNTISVQHPNNILSVYKHNSALLKKTGDRIAAGEAIAIIGNSGTCLLYTSPSPRDS